MRTLIVDVRYVMFVMHTAVRLSRLGVNNINVVSISNSTAANVLTIVSIINNGSLLVSVVWTIVVNRRVVEIRSCMFNSDSIVNVRQFVEAWR